MSSSESSKSFATLLDGFLHDSLTGDDESIRRGRLQIRFGVLGGAMAIAYSAFFFILQHYWGGAIVATSGLALMMVPLIIRGTGNLSVSGHVYGAVLVLCFAGMCAVGGGLQGAANAWLAAIPVCALLLMSLRPALVWTGICFTTIVAFAVLELSGQGFLKTFDPSTESSIEAASQIGLILFLTFIGLLFEQSRIEAFERLRVSNERLADSNSDLTDLNRQKNEFLNIAAHDLKNPLSIICGYADLLRDLESPTLEQIRSQASEILRSGNHMLDIIRNILDVRAIEDGHKRLAKQRCSIQETIQHLLTDYSAAANRKNINLIYPVSTHPPEVWADPSATYQALDNLVSNAVKYTPEGGTITIGISSSNSMVTIGVRDTGPGLSDEDQSLLWGKFVRLTPRPTGGETTNGLGLWIVRRLVDEMGGASFCHSILGEGSVFGVRLPLWKNQEESTAHVFDHPTVDRSTVPASDFDLLVAEIEDRGSEIARITIDAEADVALPS